MCHSHVIKQRTSHQRFTLGNETLLSRPIRDGVTIVWREAEAKFTFDEILIGECACFETSPFVCELATGTGRSKN